MKLHEAITKVLIDNYNTWMTYREIAEEIRSRNLYVKKDGGQPDNGQISARANKYPDLFEFDKRGDRVRIRLD
jgi:hypothetical protein